MRTTIVSIAVLALTLAATPPAAGQASQSTLIPIQSFVPIDDQQIYTAFAAEYGYLFTRGTATSLTLWAPLGVPVGVDVDSICVFAFDQSNTTSVNVRLVLSGITTTLNPPLSFDVAEASSGDVFVGGVKLCLESIDAGFEFPWRVRTTALATEVLQHFLRVVIPAQGAAPGASALGPGIVTWRRAISDEPATATFDDVPSGDDFFQYVEALAAAGVMTSCDGGNNFCPDAPVTRRQLALFLARSVGFYWPN